MSSSDKIKFSSDNFKDLDSVNEIIKSISSLDYYNDKEGYTLLCAAIMNNADPLVLVYITGSKDTEIEYDRKCKGASITQKCNKGKTPLQIAIMSGNIVAIDILLGNTGVTVNDWDKSTGRKIPKNNDGMLVLDDKGNVEFQTKTVYARELSEDDLKTLLDEKCIYNAASANSSDVLNSLLKQYKGTLFYNEEDAPKNKYNGGLCQKFDIYGNTPLIAATKAQCYESVDLILSKISDNDNCKRAIEYTNKPINGESQSAFSIAADLEDDGLISKFLNYGIFMTAIEYYYSRYNKTELYRQIDTALKNESFNMYNYITSVFTRFDYSTDSETTLYIGDEFDSYIKNESGCKSQTEISENFYSLFLNNEDKYPICKNFRKQYIECNNASLLLDEDKNSALYWIINLLYLDGGDNNLFSTDDISLIKSKIFLKNELLPVGLQHPQPIVTD
jgi:ankyrin repeat protein